MPDHPLTASTVGIVTVTTLVFLVAASRALAPRAAGKLFAWLLLPFGFAAAFTHIGVLRDTLEWTFPFGFVAGFAGAAASFVSTAARRAFDGVTDRDARLMLAVRAIFGAQLFALAALGRVPVQFAFTAGLGDLVVGWAALAAPGDLGARGSRGWRLLIHGVGLIDLVQVVVVAVTFVRPWSAAHGNSMTAMTLPWVAVPLMFAINVHGIRGAWAAERPRDARDARAVRSAVSGA